jgi:hypothetical protein
MDTSESYDELAPHYQLMFERCETSMTRQAAVLSSVPQRECGLAKTARILDWACGIGTQALGLAKAGFLESRALRRAQDKRLAAHIVSRKTLVGRVSERGPERLYPEQH